MIKSIQIAVTSQGLHSITRQIESVVNESAIPSGLCTVFVQHTSASLIIQENADPSAKYDLENWLNRLVKENDPIYTHTLEGADDMPAHIKSALTATSIAIPIMHHKLVLGTWQGVYICDQRHHAGVLNIISHLLNDAHI